MTNYQMWQALNVAIDKDGYGGMFSPVDYEDIARLVKMSFYKRKMEELYANLQAGQDKIEAIYSSKIFRSLISKETVVPATGVIDLSSTGDLSDTYGDFLTMRVTSTNKKIVLISNEELDNRIDNAITPPTADYPLCTIDGDNLRINPITITSVSLVYLKIPANPVFDYYSDSNDNIVYMTAGATGVSIPLGATYYDGTAGPTTKNSRTVEWAFDETFHAEIFTEMLTVLANRLRDQVTAVFSENKLQKQDSL